MLDSNLVLSAIRAAHCTHPLSCCLQEYSSNLGEVVDIVVSHQGLPLKTALIVRLMDALVVPSPDLYRPQLHQLARLGKLPVMTP